MRLMKIKMREWERGERKLKWENEKIGERERGIQRDRVREIEK